MPCMTNPFIWTPVRRFAAEFVQQAGYGEGYSWRLQEAVNGYTVVVRREGDKRGKTIGAIPWGLELKQAYVDEAAAMKRVPAVVYSEWPFGDGHLNS